MALADLIVCRYRRNPGRMSNSERGKVRISERAGYFFPRLVRPARAAFIQPWRDRRYFYDSSRSAILVNCVPCPWSLALVQFAKKETYEK